MGRVVGQLDERPRGAGLAVRDGEDELLDVGREHGADAHRARLHRAEDRGLAQALLADATRSLAQREDDGVRRRVVGLVDPIVGPGDHRLVHHGDGGVRALAPRDRGSCLREGLPHVQLVVHRRIIRAGSVKCLCG